MSQTLAYVRVSTEDQIEYSPDAQVKRCRDLARLRDLGPVTVLKDEGWSGKNLDRPAMRQLLALIESNDVEHLLIWRWDRLCRDSGDSSLLVKLFEEHGVTVHSVNDGNIDVASASGKMQIGVTGVFAQYFRDQIVENTKMGQRQAAERGRWQNAYSDVFEHSVRSFRTRLWVIDGRAAADAVVRSNPLNSPPSRSS